MSLSFDRYGSINEDLSNIAQKQWNDFINSNSLSPWYNYLIASGTQGAGTGSAKHPGVITYTSSSSANSGAAIRSTQSIACLSGGEKTTIIFKTASTLTGVTRRMGFHDATDQNAPADGVYLKIADGVLTGQTANNSTQSTTGTNFTLTGDTFYRAKIELNADATSAIFTLFADDSDTVLWTDSLSTNIPKTAGREIGHGDVCTIASPSGATVIGQLDYMDIILPNARKV
jgi:hypothetical protein